MTEPAGWRPVAAVVGLLVFVAQAFGGDHGAPRELPPYAVQPPGASYEKSITRAQKTLLIKDGLRATGALVLRRPLLAAAMAAGRLSERTGVLVAEAFPPGLGPPYHQSREAGGPCTPARITPLYDSVPAFDALLALIAQAQSRIDLMIFGWDDDVAGRTVAAALIARARTGVLIRLMVDRGAYVTGEGNARVPLGCPTYLDRLKLEPNVCVIEASDPWFRYDHRKVAVIDDRIVWTGGMILTRPALERWHNFAFLAEGPVVPQYAALFAERWQEFGGCAVPTCPQAAATADIVPNAAVRMVRTDVGQRSLKEAVYGAVDSACHHIYLENPYFGDPILLKKLVAARARGVEVRAVLTKRGDTRVMNEVTSLVANRLFRAGAHVYLYPAMTHVKALSVDGTLAYIGTGNFDGLSLRNNREVSLTVRGSELIRALDENLFRRDMACSEELRALLPAPRNSALLRATLPLY